MAQLSNLINCKVRVVDGLCKVHEYEQAYLSTVAAAEDALDRFTHPIFSIQVKATGKSLFNLPNIRVS